MSGTSTKPAALNPVMAMQPQRTKLISANFHSLPWDNEGDGNNLPLMPRVKELVNCKTLSCFNVREMGSGQANHFYPRTIRTLMSVEILELVCYQAWRIFHHDERWWFLCLGPPLSSSLVPAHTGEYGAEIYLVLGVSSQTIPTISHPLLGRCFFKA